MVTKHTVQKPVLELKTTLGEGCVWDPRTRRLYFVDIDQYKVYTYDPSSGEYGYELFDKKVTALSLLENGQGLITAVEDSYAYIPFYNLPFPPTASKQPLIPIVPRPALGPHEQRFNDAAVDPAGRYLAGTMGFVPGTTADARLYSLQQENDGSYSAPLVLDKVTCTNGMGWANDGKTMYFSDSWTDTIFKFDYDVATGNISNRRIFSDIQGYGTPDGMCMDTKGGVWTCRWGAGKLLRLSPDGEVDVEIDFPTAWHITCCIFGGENMDELYVTTAISDYRNDEHSDRIHGGDLFVVTGLGYKGVERGRFKGSMPTESGSD